MAQNCLGFMWSPVGLTLVRIGQSIPHPPRPALLTPPVLTAARLSVWWHRVPGGLERPGTVVARVLGHVLLSSFLLSLLLLKRVDLCR